jgi:uncharacterized repeat protein (TIGR01451 family)
MTQINNALSLDPISTLLSDNGVEDDAKTIRILPAPLAAQATTSSTVLPIPYESGEGGAEGKTQIVDLGVMQGIVDVSYETYSIPDRLQLVYEGSVIFDTGFESTTEKRTLQVPIPVGGHSSQLTSILTANSNVDTLWNYSLNLESQSKPLIDSNGNNNLDTKDSIYEFLAKEAIYKTNLTDLKNLAAKYNYEVNKIFDDKTTGFYAIGFTSKTKAPVLVIRGTEPTQDNFADIITDINPKGIGFYQYEKNSVAPLQWLTDIRNLTGLNPDIIGHSLGGALAQDFAAYSKDSGKAIGDVVTFNSPGISTTTVDKFDSGKGNVTRVQHYITSGDIVSLAGEKFLPGGYEILDISNNLVPGYGLYANHVAPVLYSTSYPDGTKLSVKSIFKSTNDKWLNSDFFTYVDQEYFATIAAAELVTQTIPRLQKYQTVPLSLIFRGTVEKNREEIGQKVEEIAKDITNISNGNILAKLPDQNFNIPGLRIKSDNLSIHPNGLESLEVQGKVSLPDIFNATANFAGNNYIKISNSAGLEIVGDLSVNDIKIVPQLWEVKDAHLKFNTPNETVSASASVLIPGGVIVGGNLGIKNGKLDLIGLNASNLNIPIATTGTFLQSIGGNIKNLSNLNQIEFNGDVNITGGKKIDISLPWFMGGNISGSLISLDVSGQINRDQLTGNGNILLLGGLAKGTATATLDWNKNFLYADAKLSILGNFISTQSTLRTNSNFDIALYGKSDVKIPDAAPILAGKSLASSVSRLQYTNNNNPNDDFIAVSGAIDVPFIGAKDVGIKINFDGKYSWNPGKELFSVIGQPLSSVVDSSLSNSKAPLAQSLATQSNQYITQTNTKWLIMNAEWSNSKVTPLAIKVKSPDGKVISESDFAANNIAIIKDLTDSKNKSIIINKPLAGAWSMEVVDSTGLSNLQYRAFRDAVAPTIQLDPIVDTGTSNFTINYKAIDPDSAAKVSLFYSSDNKDFNGALIKNDLAENDGAGNFIWNTEGLAAGDYYVYAMITDDDTAPVFSYAPGKIKVTESDDLIITKTADRDSVAIGGIITYTMIVTNNGTSTSKGVVLTDELPLGSKLVSSSVNPSTNAKNQLTFDLGDLAKGISKTISVTISPQATGNTKQDNQVQTITGTARVTSRTFDPNVNNNVSVITTSVTPIPADISISGSVSSNTANLGDDVTYNLVIANNGTTIAKKVVLSDQLPSGLRAQIYKNGSASSGLKFVTSNGSNISEDNKLLVTANLGDIEPGKNVTVSMTGAAIVTSDLINNAKVTSDIFETNYANNYITQKISVQPVTPTPVDLELTQSVNKTNPKVGDNVTFTLTLGNKGSSIASGIKITDILPAGLSYISSNPTQGGFNPQTGIWDVGNIRDGLVVTLDIVSKVTASTGTIINNASITAVSQKDPNINNDRASASITIGSILSVNNAPVVSKPLVNASATQDKPFTLALPASAFTDIDAGDVLTYSASLADGAALPTWLKLDAATGTFTGTPTNPNLGNFQVKVTATDKAKATVSSTFALNVVKNSVLPTQPLTLQKATNDNIWNVNGLGKVNVSLLGKKTSQLNEIGIFKLDANNQINGIAPGAAGFKKAAIESGSVVFDVLPDRTTDGLDLNHSLQVNNGDRLGFFMVSNGNVEDDIRNNNFSNVTTSADLVNPYIVAPLEVLENQGAYTLNWKQENQALSLQLQVDNMPDTPLSSISSLQGKPEGEVLDLRAFVGQNVQATFTMKREAAYNDSVSFYKIDDAAGTVTSLSGETLHPGDYGYIQAALANVISGLNLAGKNGQTITADKTLQGGSLYAPILMTNVTAGNPTGDHVFTAFSLGNADRTDHVRLLGGNTFGFEDLIGGGDKDFNDVIVQASFKTV